MFLHLPIRTLEVCTEVLPGFSHVHSTDHFITTLLSQGCILEAASGNEKGKLNAQSKAEEGVMSLQVSGCSLWARLGTFLAL